MALNDAYGDAGRGVWTEWSASSAKYNAADQEKNWRSFTPGGGITIDISPSSMAIRTTPIVTQSTLMISKSPRAMPMSNRAMRTTTNSRRKRKT
jgi:hypothetical protein